MKLRSAQLLERKLDERNDQLEKVASGHINMMQVVAFQKAISEGQIVELPQVENVCMCEFLATPAPTTLLVLRRKQSSSPSYTCLDCYSTRI